MAAACFREKLADADQVAQKDFTKEWNNLVVKTFGAEENRKSKPNRLMVDGNEKIYEEQALAIGSI